MIRPTKQLLALLTLAARGPNSNPFRLGAHPKWRPLCEYGYKVDFRGGSEDLPTHRATPQNAAQRPCRFRLIPGPGYWDTPVDSSSSSQCLRLRQYEA